MRLNHEPTEEVVGDGDRKGVLRALAIGLLCLVVANALALAAGQRPSLNRAYWLVHEKWRRLETLSEPVDYLILGDSACNQGIRPDVFDEVTGAKSVNLCTIGNMLAVNDAWMLDAYLQKHDPPKGVVIVHVYDVWQRTMAGRAGPVLLAKVPLPWGFWREAKPAVSFDVEEKWRFFASRYLPLYADNESIGGWIREGRLFRDIPYALDAKGYMAVRKADPKEVDRDTKEHLEFVKEHAFELSDDNRAALDRVVELADSRGFDVYFASSPMHDALTKDPKLMAYMNELGKVFQGYASRSRRVHWVLPRPMPFSRDVMENSDHLVDSAAAIYTRALATAVARTRTR